MEHSLYLDVPLAAVLGVVVLVVLLDGDVGQVDEGVVHVAHVRVVLGVTEAREAVHVLVGLQRPVARHQHVDAQVKLLAT
jgi:hypothetical protein